ncbi:hypothetical protein [Robiginitalea sp. SC105]|uniref:hypothetical protein n=1 Tax=Robiginitalea sp. SC105 TaxID=2762332 RepID=UPI00163B322E|nr:hypothetical protein [Robiginitalea sp. SC105]MBC2838591.1 hypothetical protein [Robiginitalea sp. SC105]
MKVKLKKLALLAEIIGGFAVLISLVFVGFQFRENAKATKSANASATISSLGDWYQQIGNNQQSSELFYNFMAAPDSLTPQQRFQAVMNVHGIFIIFQNSYYLSKEGTLDAEMRNALTSVILGVKDQPGFHFYWKQRKSFFFKEFRDYIEEVVNNNESINSVYKDFSEE